MTRWIHAPRPDNPGIAGRPCHDMIYLGAWLSRDGTPNRMVKERIASARAGWCALGRYWNSPTSRRLKIQVFSCAVYNSALSGLEPFVLTHAQEVALDSTILEYGRRLLGNDAQWFANERWYSIENKEWKLLRLAPIRVGLRSRRLKWVQDIIRYPQENRDLTATLFGTFPFEDPQPDWTTDTIPPTADPWI